LDFGLVKNFAAKNVSKGTRRTASCKRDVAKAADDILSSSIFALNTCDFIIIPDSYSCSLAFFRIIHSNCIIACFHLRFT